MVAALRRISPEDCAISTVTLFELVSGAGKSANPPREFQRIEKLRAPFIEIPWDESAAIKSAEVRCALESKGQKIGAYDTLLAGHALALNLIFVTDNVKEFSRVDGLVVENWR